MFKPWTVWKTWPLTIRLTKEGMQNCLLQPIFPGTNECWNTVQGWRPRGDVWVLARKLQANRCLWPQFFRSTNCSWDMVSCSSQVQWIGVSLLLIFFTVCCCYLFILLYGKTFVPHMWLFHRGWLFHGVWLAAVIGHVAHMTPNPQSINFQVIWIRVAIA